jgi:hypothetical protein
VEDTNGLLYVRVGSRTERSSLVPKAEGKESKGSITDHYSLSLTHTHTNIYPCSCIDIFYADYSDCMA